MKENERKMKMVVKGISRTVFRRIALESYPTVHLGGGPMTVLEDYPAIRLGGLSNRFYRNSVVCFREQKPFVLTFGLGMCERVGDDSRHGIGHVDIQVGSCVFLNVFGCHYMCT